jgi:hypothetical protein
LSDHILQEFNTLFLARFRTYKIALPPPKKPYTYKHLSQSPFTGQFFKTPTFGIAFYESNHSTRDRSGLPDLTLWNPETEEIWFVEVKGPGDKLSFKQILWIR